MKISAVRPVTYTLTLNQEEGECLQSLLYLARESLRVISPSPSVDFDRWLEEVKKDKKLFNFANGLAEELDLARRKA